MSVKSVCVAECITGSFVCVYMCECVCECVCVYMYIIFLLHLISNNITRVCVLKYVHTCMSVDIIVKVVCFLA